MSNYAILLPTFATMLGSKSAINLWQKAVDAIEWLQRDASIEEIPEYILWLAELHAGIGQPTGCLLLKHLRELGLDQPRYGYYAADPGPTKDIALSPMLLERIVDSLPPNTEIVPGLDVERYTELVIPSFIKIGEFQPVDHEEFSSIAGEPTLPVGVRAIANLRSLQCKRNLVVGIPDLLLSLAERRAGMPPSAYCVLTGRLVAFYRHPDVRLFLPPTPYLGRCQLALDVIKEHYLVFPQDIYDCAGVLKALEAMTLKSPAFI